MKHLVYLIAFGYECLNQFRECLKGLQACDVDILLITDMPVEGMNEGVNLKVIHANNPGTAKEQMIFRIYIEKYVDISGYNRITYMDCDILVFRDVFSQLTDNRIYLACEPALTLANDCFNGCLKSWEKYKYWHSPAVNAGIYSVPRPQYKFFEYYKQATENAISIKPKMNIPEQMSLNAIFVREKQRFNMTLFDSNMIGYPEKGVKGTEPLYHYACYPFEWKLTLMQKAWQSRTK